MIVGNRDSAATIRDLSAAGMHVDTDAPIEQRQHFELQFELGDTPLELQARAVYVTPGQSTQHSLGARLLHPPASALSLLADYVLDRSAACRV